MPIQVTNPHSIRLPGDFELKDVFIKSPFHKEELSLREIMSELQLFESIFKNTLTGFIEITDTQNLFVNWPIVGYETIEMIFDNPSDEDFVPITKKFRIYTITNYVMDGESSAGYRISFISEEFITNLKVKVSKSYRSQTISKMVENVFSEYLGSDKNLMVEETKNLQDYVIPYWSPFYLMNWFSSRALSDTEKGANYFFYETLDEFRFVSLEGLIREARKLPDSVHEVYKYRMKNVDPYGQMLPDEYAVATEYQVDKTFDIFQNLSLGMYGNRIIAHDIVKRSYQVLDWDYAETYDDYLHTEENTKVQSRQQVKTMLASEEVQDFQESQKAYQMFLPTHFQLHGNMSVPNRDTLNHEKVLQSRVSQLQQINTYKMTVTISGDFNRRAGDLVYFEMPNTGAEEGSEITEDLLYSGNYIVLSIRHMIDSTSHETLLELAKDSYFTTLPSVEV